MQPNGLLTRRIAFLDIETTGLSPSLDRIAEIGVVTQDGDRVASWTTLLSSNSSRRTCEGAWQGAPRFADIASDLARRLEGCLLFAHNARFDHAFLAAELERAGIHLECDVVCTVMLSRRLYPDLAHHDLDSLVRAFDLVAGVRHRALPDADLLRQWWRAICRAHDAATLERAIGELLEGPVLPEALDPAIVSALPAKPGAYVFHGEKDEPLMVGAAANLRARVINYFRINRASGRALEHAHRVRNITWRATRGMIGARLHAAQLARVNGTRRSGREITLRFEPAAIPCVSVAPIVDGNESFGRFDSERKAVNALARLAIRHRLCHAMLGIDSEGCRACPVDGTRGGCRDETQRKKQLLRVYPLLRPMRIDAWPHDGPVGLRERSDLHVVDRWQFLGTARNEGDVHALLDARREPFDFNVYRLLNRELAKLTPDRIVSIGQRK